MNKIFKLSIITLSIVVTLLIIAILLLPSLINTDTVKHTLIKQVQERTGQTLTIEGELSLSVFPWLGLETNKITLSQDPELSPEPFLQMDAANIGVKLLPLFRRKIEVGQIELKKPKLYYVIAKNGKTSIDSFNNSLPGDTEKAEASTQKDVTNNVGSTEAIETQENITRLERLIITGIKVSEGYIVYDDKASGIRHEIDNLNLMTGNLLSSSPSPVSLSADITPDGEAASQLLLELKANANFDITSGQLSANSINSSLVKAKQEETINININSLLFDANKQTIKTKLFTLKAKTQDVSPVVSAPFIDINLKEYSIAPIQYSITEEKTQLNATGEISLNHWHKNPMIKGMLNSEAINPSKLMALLKIDYKANDNKALQSLDLNTRFSVGSNGLSLHDLKITLDDSELSGDASIINYKKPQYRFDLNLDNINLDRYTPKPDSNKTSSTSSAGLAIAAPIPLFKELKANGVFRAKSVQANGAKLKNIRIGIISENKKVVITPTAQLYKGKTKGTITFTENGDTSTLLINNQLTNIDLEPLLIDTDISDQLSGLATSNINLTVTDKNNKQTNEGIITLAVKNGALKGVDIKKILDDTQNNFDRLRGKLRANEGEEVSAEGSALKSDETHFAEMAATLNLKDNLITNKDLSIKAPAFRVKGKGEIQLETEKLDYLTNIAIVNTNSGQGGLEREELKGAVIPIRFYGKIAEPKYKVDMRALIKENTKQEVKKKKEELKKKVLEKLDLKEIKNSTEDQKDQSSEEQLKDELKKKLLNELFK